MREDDEAEDLGTDQEQIIAMLERSEIDYQEDVDDDGEEVFGTILDINGTVRMVFDDEGTLVEVNPIPN